MPRYYFDTVNGQVCSDETGTDLADLRTARAEAVRAGGAILRDAGGSFWDSRRWAMMVRDEAGQRLFTLHVSVEEHGP